MSYIVKPQATFEGKATVNIICTNNSCLLCSTLTGCDDYLPCYQRTLYV